MEKVIFVNLYSPMIKRYPLGTAYLIATVKNRTSFTPVLFDENYLVHRKKKSTLGCFKAFEEALEKHKPKYVTFTYFQNHVQRFNSYAKLIKTKLPQCKIIIGGIHPTVFRENLLKHSKRADILVRGEGELILSNILNGKRLKNIPNLVYRNKGGIVETPVKQNYNYDIDRIPWPHRKKFDMELYSNSTILQNMMRPTATMLLSRGCPANCSFCASREIYGKFRIRRPQNAIKELHQITRDFPYIRHIYFTDNCFNLKHSKVKRFLQLFREAGFHKKLSFGIQTRLEYIDKETVKILQDSNCIFVGIGLESFSPHIQRDVGKVFSISQFKTKNKLLQQSGIFTAYTFIFNYPGMDYKDARFNIQKIEENNLKYVSIGYLDPIPQTKVYKQLVAQNKLPGLDHPEISWDHNFIKSWQKEKFWNVTQEQEKKILSYIRKKMNHGFWYWFFRLSLKQQFKYVYRRTGFSPVKMLRSLWQHL